MKDKAVRVLIVEDQEDLAADARREIEEAFEENEEIDVEVAVETDFDEGFAKVQRGESDVVVLDVRRDTPDPSADDETAGRTVFFNIKEACFAPIIFWTALPEKVRDDEMTPLVTVVTKQDMDELPKAIEAAIASRAVTTITDIETHVATVLRQHMWTELAPNWAEYTKDGDSADIAQVLLSRLARVLDQDREQSFTAHPSHRYIYPPASNVWSPGDVLRSLDGTWWVVLTPACDFEQEKVEFVLLAKANPLEAHPKYEKWAGANDGSSNKDNYWTSLRQHVLMATQGRFHFLPAFREIPDLVIDLENVKSVPVKDLDDENAVASLVSPFAEALLVQHSHFRGRIGVPDLDSELIKVRLIAE